MGQTAAIIALTAVSAGAAIYQGRQAAQAEQFRQDALEKEKQSAAIRARDEAIQRTRQLEEDLGTAAAMGAQSGFDPSSMGSSFLAIREKTEKYAKEDLQMIRLLGANQKDYYSSQISQSKVAARAATNLSFLKAADSLGTGYKQYLETK